MWSHCNYIRSVCDGAAAGSSFALKYSVSFYLATWQSNCQIAMDGGS
jgi:hypothetical protein